MKSQKVEQDKEDQKVKNSLYLTLFNLANFSEDFVYDDYVLRGS